MAKVLAFFVLSLLGPSAFAGYQGYSSCYATLGEAVTKVAYLFTSQCGSGNCRILSYVPVTGQAQVIVGGSIQTFTVTSCASATVPLDGGLVATPFYASDTGTVSACGATVSGAGGVSGGSGGGVATLAGWSMTAEEGAMIGVAVASLFALAGVWRVLQSRDSESEE